MKLKKKLHIEELGGRYVAIGGEDKGFKGMLYLNEPGNFIAGLLENEISREEIVKEICERYDMEEERANTNLDRLLKTFAKADLIENDN